MASVPIARELCDLFGIDYVTNRIIAGDTYDVICRDMGVSRGSLQTWLDEFHPSEFARAKSQSAEAWLDRGLEVMASALDKKGDIDATAARGYAHECARRAAIRNPAYRDKPENTVQITVNPLADAIRRIQDAGSAPPLAISGECRRED